MSLEAVAKRAKVSTSTVSRVVNGVGFLKPATRQRVMKAVEELKYYPNLHARSLAAGRSRTIGVIVSNLQNPFFVDIFHAIESDAHAAGYEVVVANTNYSPKQLVASVHIMLGRRVAGLAIMVSEMEAELISEVSRADIPVVFFDVGAIGAKMRNIRFDYRKGMVQVVDYLHSLGHQRMAYIGLPISLQSTDERKHAFMETGARRSIRTMCVSVPGHDGLAGGRDAVRELLRSGFDPTAILCVNDIIAIGVLRELRNQGIRVPADVSVTGFDNISLAEFSCPSLTTVHIPRERIGHLVFGSLVPGPHAVASPAGEEYLVDPALVVRESTGLSRRAATS
jgi:LacI family transcriptional regulator